jgi:hypothetical protein
MEKLNPTKHIRYLSYYKPNDYYWGIGIENETYFQFNEPNLLRERAIYESHSPERYSVDYFVGLNSQYKDLLKQLFPEGTHAIPLYMNSHSFQKTDVKGNHVTTYEPDPKPNPCFSGETIHQTLCKANPAVFKDKYTINYVFDGDTIEFMTQNFYKGTVKSTIAELLAEKKIFLEALNQANLFPALGSLSYPKRNEPFVSFLTNRKNLAIFNNGTYHFNFTLPTQLNEKNEPVNMTKFILQHKAAIRYIQYLEPLLLVVYGTPDPFSKVSDKFSKASQRAAVSRYIGIGTYDTNAMKPGKILKIDTKTCPQAHNNYWWYTSFTKDSYYKPLDEIGADINFNKHGAHGIELRFFDWFPEEKLEEVMNLIVHVLDASLKYGCPADPTVCPIWNGLVVRVLIEGNVTLTPGEYEMFSNIFRLNFPTFLCWLFKRPHTKATNVESLLGEIRKSVSKIKGQCSKRML